MSHGDEQEHTTPEAVLSETERDTLLAAVADVTISLDSDGIIQTIADEEMTTLGYPANRLAGRPVTSLFVPDAQPSPLFDVLTATEFENALFDSETDTVTAPLEAADGTTVALSLTTVDRPDETGLVCLGQERPEQASQVRDQRPGDELFDSVADPVYVLDSDDRFQRVNDALVEYTGYDRTELLGRNLADILPTTAYERATATLRDLVAEDDDSGTFETTVITKDGKRILTEAHVTPITEDAGDYDGSVAVLRDIRERKHREQNLDLLKQVLTRVFRHNIRNELGIAQAHAELLEEQAAESLQTHAEEILETTDRLLSHSEKARQIERVLEADDQTSVDIADATRQIIDTAADEYPDAQIDVNLPDEARIQAHPEIASAIEELVENAIEHAPADGPARVDIWLDHQEDRQTLFVEDESGGLATNEIDVLERGREDNLTHSSGVGLWLIRWLVEYSNAELIVHRTTAGALMGIRFDKQMTADAPPDDLAESPLADAPSHVREPSPRRFKGETVIGRTETLDRLEEVYDGLARTGGHSLLVTGEAGIGKTTLVEQFRERIATRSPEPLIATGFCESDVQPSYHAFRQVIDDIPSERDLPEILSDAAALSADDPDELEQRKQGLFDDIADELRAVASQRPVVLIVEDMHWADTGTIDLFESLVDDVGQWGHPVLFLGTYRTSDIDETHPVLEIAEETADAGRGTILDLAPLDTEEVQSLISYMFGIADPPASFVDSVSQQTGGTPLFVSELCRHLAETLAPVQTAADLPDTLDGIDVPETVESAIADRLDALPAAVQPVLRLSAVLGREFSFDLLWEASDQSTDALIEASNTLVQREVWHHSGATLEFLHGVVREQTLEMIPADERGRLHASAAAAIETVHADALDEYAGRLGFHYEQVGDDDTAFQYYRQAGEYESDTYANDDAIEHYERALSLVEQEAVADEATAAAVAIDLGAISRRLGKYDQAAQYYERSLDTYRAIDDRNGEARSLHYLGVVAESQGAYEQANEYFEHSLSISREEDARQIASDNLTHLGSVVVNQGKYDQAEEYLKESLTICREIGNRQGQANNLHTLGNIAYRRGAYDQAVGYYEDTLEIRRETENKRGLAKTLNNLGLVARDRGAYDQAIAYSEESLAIKREIGDQKGQASTLGNLGIIAGKQGSYDEAVTYYEESLTLYRDVGDPQGQAHNLHNLGLNEIRRGAYEQAAEFLKESLEIYREIGYPQGESNNLSALGTIAIKHGSYDEAREYIEQSLKVDREIGDRSGEANSLTKLGYIAAERGEYDRAREHTTESLEICREIGNQDNETNALQNLGYIAARTGELEQAREYLTDALEMAREIGLILPELTSLRELGVVARKQAADEQATEYFQQALDVCDPGENPRERTRVRLEQARLAFERGEVETARETTEQARREFAELGAVHDEARATLLRGRVAAANGSPDEARKYWQDALETFKDVGAPQDALRTLDHLVGTCRQQDDDEQADEYREQATELFETAPDPVRAKHSEWLTAGD